MRMINADLIQYEPMLSAKGNGMYEDVMVAYKSQIDDLPTIEERKTGKWIETDSHEPCWFKCDQCGRLSDIKEIYCPTCGASMANTTCGADMRGDDHEND